MRDVKLLALVSLFNWRKFMKKLLMITSLSLSISAFAVVTGAAPTGMTSPSGSGTMNMPSGASGSTMGTDSNTRMNNAGSMKGTTHTDTDASKTRQQRMESSGNSSRSGSSAATHSGINSDVDEE
jgi:hypothetical protein